MCEFTGNFKSALNPLFYLKDANKLWNDTDSDQLKRDLLDGYDPLVRPANHKLPTSLHVHMTLINIELDEMRGVLTTHAWLKMNWSDPKLSWKKADYGDINELRIAADEVNK